jgi:hypothetical protein
MRKILLLTLLFICFKASAQQTYWTPGVPPSSTSFTPSFRNIGTDSLAKFYLANGNRYSQIYTAAQVNALIGSSGVTTGILNGLSLTASGTTAHVATGQYAINGTTYTIGSIVTQTIPAQNDSLSRYVVFYGTTSGVIDTALGILGTDAVYPNVRNNTAQIGSVLITPTSVTAGGVTGVYALLHGNNNLSGGFTGINAFYGPTNWHGNQKFYKLPSIITSGTALVLGADSVVHRANIGVTSFNSRTGAILPLSGDYSTFYQPIEDQRLSTTNSPSFQGYYEANQTTTPTTTGSTGTFIFSLNNRFTYKNLATGYTRSEYSNYAGNSVIKFANLAATTTEDSTHAASTYYLQTNPSSYVSRTGVSATTPLAYNSGTGIFTIQQANTSQSGYLSNTDWNTFNGKQTALSGTGYAKFTGSSVAYNATIPTTDLSTASTAPTASYLINRDANANAFANNFVSNYATTVTSATTYVLTAASAQQQYFTGSTAQTVTLPVVTTLTNGFSFILTNNSTQTITVNSSGGNLVQAIGIGNQTTFTCISTTAGTGASSWYTLGNGTYATLAGNQTFTGANTFSQQIIAPKFYANTSVITPAIQMNGTPWMYFYGFAGAGPYGGYYYPSGHWIFQNGGTFTDDGNSEVQITGRERLTQGLTGVIGTDSIAVHDNTSKQIKWISPTTFAASASASSDFTAQTTAGTITSVTSAAATSTYNVGAYLNVTAVTTDVIEVQIIFTDENNTAQTITLPTVSTTGYVSMTPQIIRVKASTTITVKTTLTTGVGSITFDTGAYITKSY